MQKFVFHMAVLVFFGTPAAAETLNLICTGGGTGTTSTVATATSRNAEGNYVTTNAIGSEPVSFQDQISVEINGDTGRIRLPNVMLSNIHGGKDGWYELRKIQMTEREITARAAVNFISAAKVRLDRMTGQIVVDGHEGRFSGHCEAYDPATAKRKF